MNNKVLYISSLDPTIGPGAIAMDHYLALKSGGYDVDFLTLLPVEGHPEIKYALKSKFKKYSFHQLYYKITKFFVNPKYYKDKGFFYRKEDEPPVSFRRIQTKILNDYDLIIVFFWQGLLSYKTLLEICKYQKKIPKVLFICADYSPMTGGCHFFGSCERYSSECGHCPMINSNKKHDFTNLNNRFRQEVIKQIRPFIAVNTYMKGFFEKSTVVKAGARLISMSLTMDLNKFKPIDRSLLIKKFGFIDEYRFIMLFGCQNLHDPRKGIEYLIESLNYFYDKLTDEERSKVLLISIGKDNGELANKIKFERKHFGYLSFDDLPTIYSIANVFLSPSVNDAGPSMVNQSIACGTPVIAFKIGTALDVIENQGTGFTVPMKDTEAFANRIWELYKLNEEDRKRLSMRCREVAIQYQSYDAMISKVNECFGNA